MPAPNAQWIPMVNPEGITEDVHVDDAAKAIGQGYQLETPEGKQLRDYQTTQGGSISEGLTSFGEHALSSATFGVSDWALSHDEEYRKNRQLRDATFAAPRWLGEAAGYLVPGLAEAKGAGLLGKAAKVVAAPVSTVSRVASAAGRGAEHLLSGEAPGIGRALLAKTAGGLTSGALEGAALGAGQALSEASIQDKPLTAELLLSHVRDGAIVGGTMGGGISFAGGLLSATGRAIRSSGIAQHLPGIGDAMAAGGTHGGLAGVAEMKGLTSVGFMGSDIKRIIKEGGPDAPHILGRRIIDELGYAGPGAVGRAVKHDMATAAEGAGEQLRKYNDDLHSVYRRFEDAGDRVHIGEIVRQTQDEVLSRLRNSHYGGDRRVATQLESELAPLTERIERAEGIRESRQLVDAWQKKIGEYHEVLTSGTAAAADLSKVLRADAVQIADHMRTYGMREAATQLESVSKSMEMTYGWFEKDGVTKHTVAAAARSVKKGMRRLNGEVNESVREFGDPTMSYGEVWGLRQRVDQDVTTWEAKQDARADAYRAFRNVLKDQIERQAARTGLAKEFAAANQGVHDWLAIEKVARGRAGQIAGNRTIGLTDTIVGSTGASVGAALGGGVGGGLGMLTATAGNKLLRSAAGDRLLSTMANRYSNWRSVVKATDDAALALARRSHAAVGAVPVKQRTIGFALRMASEYDRQRQEVLKRQADRELMVSQLERETGDLRSVAPELTTAIVAASGRGQAYLASTLPETPGLGGLPSRVHKLEPPESEQAAWLRVANLVRQPGKLPDRVKEGKLTHAEVQGVSTAYPSLYEAIRTQVVSDAADAADRGRLPDYQKRLQLSILTGMPLEPTMRPEVIAAYQQLHASMAAPTPQRGPGLPTSPTRASKFAERRRNFTEREV
jgi:hypothetical protein